MGEKLKLGNIVFQVQLVVRAGIKPGTSDSNSGVLTTPPRGLPQKNSINNRPSLHSRATFDSRLVICVSRLWKFFFCLIWLRRNTHTKITMTTTSKIPPAPTAIHTKRGTSLGLSGLKYLSLPSWNFKLPTATC